MQKVSIMIFKPRADGTWERMAVFQGPGSANSMPILPLVLHGGHYFAVNKTSVKTHFRLEWVTQEGTLFAQSLVDTDNQTYRCARAGGLTPRSSAGSRSDSIARLLRTCCDLSK